MGPKSRAVMWVGLLAIGGLALVTPSFTLAYCSYVISGSIYYSHLTDMDYHPSLLDLSLWPYSMYMVLVKGKRSFT